MRHALTVGGEKTKVLAEYRGALEGVLDKFLVSTWQSCARQLFAAADPVQLVGASGITADAPSASGASGIIADAPYGLSDATDTELLHKISTMSLDKWPSWCAAHFDALWVQPQLQSKLLNSDENQPARV